MSTGSVGTRIGGRINTVLASRHGSLAARLVGSALVVLGVLVAVEGQLVAGLAALLLGWVLIRVARYRRVAGRLEDLLGGLTARDALVVDPTALAPTLTIATLLEQDGRQRGGSGVYPVRAAGELLGIVDVLDADAVDRDAWAGTRVDAIMRPVDALVSVAPDRPLLDAVSVLERSRREAIAVVDPADPSRFLGLMTRERVHALIRSRSAAKERDRGRLRRAAGR